MGPKEGLENRGTRRGFGDDLLSHQVSLAVPSALRSLTSVFGMGTGVASSLWSPKVYSLTNYKKTRIIGWIESSFVGLKD